MARKQHACFSWSLRRATVTLGIRISDGWGGVSVDLISKMVWYTNSIAYRTTIDDQTSINSFPICMFVPSVRRYPFFKQNAQHRIERFDWARLQVVIHLAGYWSLLSVPILLVLLMNLCWPGPNNNIPIREGNLEDCQLEFGSLTLTSSPDG